MSIKANIENHAVILYLGLAAAAFASGFGSRQALIEYNEQRVVSEDRYASLKDGASEVAKLRLENDDLRADLESSQTRTASAATAAEARCTALQQRVDTLSGELLTANQRSHTLAASLTEAVEARDAAQESAAASLSMLRSARTLRVLTVEEGNLTQRLLSLNSSIAELDRKVQAHKRECPTNPDHCAYAQDRLADQRGQEAERSQVEASLESVRGRIAAAQSSLCTAP